jgi:hypothetical protein
MTPEEYNRGDIDAIQRVWAANDDRHAIDSLCGIYVPCVDYFSLGDMVAALSNTYASCSAILTRLISKGIIKSCGRADGATSLVQMYILTDEARLYYHF